MFSDEPAVQYVHEILRKCVVESESETKLLDAGELLGEVDTTISAVSHGCQVPGENNRMRCRFCGIGTYEKSENYPIIGNIHTGYERNFFVCSHCGHLESFIWSPSKPPPAWVESN